MTVFLLLVLYLNKIDVLEQYQTESRPMSISQKAVRVLKNDIGVLTNTECYTASTRLKYSNTQILARLLLLSTRGIF